MFVGSTFLNSLDRLSIKSPLTGRTGTICGVIGTLGLISAIVLLFLWPIVNYFKGDYIQGTYLTQKSEAFNLATGCDFKIAIAFYEKSTGKLIDHLSVKKYIKTRTAYVDIQSQKFYANVLGCNSEYFKQMEGKLENIESKDCYISQNGLSYKSSSSTSSFSVFGFKMDPICRDPLACTYNSAFNQATYSYRLQFFKKHYYVLSFTASYVDQYGKLQKKFYQAYSTQWSSKQSIIPILYANFETAKVYMDNSIMPWYNNETILYPQWMGMTYGVLATQYSVQSQGFGAYIQIKSNQRVYTRDYKKLDWALGMLGGGMLFLFIIFWVPCNFIATLKEKYQICQSTIMIRYDDQNFHSIDNAFRPSLSNPFWWLTRLIQIDLKIFKMQNKSIQYSQRYLDISDLIKKIKISKKNLSKFSNQVKFQQKVLKFKGQTNKQFDQQQKRLQIKQDFIKQIKNEPQMQKLYNNNLAVLALLNKYNEDNSSIMKLRMNAIMKNQKFSKIERPQLKNQRRSICVRLFKSIIKYFSKFIAFFDVFGAKPTLCGNPHNYTVFGCVLTFIIVVISVLAFALTIANLNVKRTYWDTIYQDPAKQDLELITGKNFRMAICFPSSAIQALLVTTQSRKLNVQFYQYLRENQQQIYSYYDSILVDLEDPNYFDITSPSYDLYNFSTCLKPKNDISIRIYGDAHSKKQAYIGFRMGPYCSGTGPQCLNMTDVNTRFWNVMSNYPFKIVTSQSRYFPELGEVKQNPVSEISINSINSNTLTLNKSIHQQIHLQILEIIDHYGSWFMGSYPPAKQKYLNHEVQMHQMSTISIDTPEPQYKLKVSLSGKISRVIFSSYKIDFLFATIGGCFAFFFIVFGWIGKGYNYYNFKLNLIQELYGQDYKDVSIFKSFLQWIGISYCSNKVLFKIENDMDSIRLAKKIDTLYRLSVVKFKNSLEKDLALIYLKQRIKQDEKIDFQKVQQHKDDENIIQDYFTQIRTSDYPINYQLNQQNQQIGMSGNLQLHDQLSQQQLEQKIYSVQQQVQQVQQVDEEIIEAPDPSVRQLEKCSFVNQYDIFANDPQLTLDGKRTVKSACGGSCFIILLVFICLLTSHFLNIYFDQTSRVSIDKIVEQNSQNLKMSFKVGQNIKLAISFYKINDFSYFDVYNITSNVGIALLKYKIERLENSTQSTIETINLQPCKLNYLANFSSDHDPSKLLYNLNKAYCVPDGIQINLYGTTQDKTRQYFSLKIYNRQGLGSLSLNETVYLFQNYLIRYHVSSPIVDFRTQGKQIFSMKDIIKISAYELFVSRTFNQTITKNKISYDTAIYSSNQIPSFNSYELSTSPRDQYSSFQLNAATDRFFQLNFVGQNLFNNYVVKTIKINQIFGMIGGCIALLFFGIGCIPKNFNQYRMRYIIATKLYTILGRKKKIKAKNVKGKKKKSSKYSSELDLTQFSDWRLLFSWFCSYIAFFTRKFNINQSTRHVALLQSRVSKDINILQIMKNIISCENAIKSLKISKADLTKIYHKQIISIQDESQEAKQKLIEEVKNFHKDLQDATKVNQFSYWDLNIILTAKEQGIDFSKIFKEKWLDRFVGIDRSTVGTRTQLGSTLSSVNLDNNSTNSQNNANTSQIQSQKVSQFNIEQKTGKKMLNQIKQQNQLQRNEEQLQESYQDNRKIKNNYKVLIKTDQKSNSQEKYDQNIIDFRNLQTQLQNEKNNMNKTNRKLQIIQKQQKFQYQN